MSNSERSAQGIPSTIKELTVEELDPRRFIQERVAEIKALVWDRRAINALSGGVDSSTVTMIGHLALGKNLNSYFIDNGLMREGEPEWVVNLFRNLGVDVVYVDAQEEFFAALKGVTHPEEKREAITQTFYKKVFGRLVRESGARHLLQGTNYTDIEETVAGIKRQHNVLKQLGINTEEQFGYKVIEPLAQLRKPAIREVAKALGLPKTIYDRPPFPGPALATRIIGEVTPERVRVVRIATSIVENELSEIPAFQSLAILHEDRVTGIFAGKRQFGSQIEVRSWISEDGRTGSPAQIPYQILEQLTQRILAKLPEVVSVTYNITKKPPSTIEAV